MKLQPPRRKQCFPINNSESGKTTQGKIKSCQRAAQKTPLSDTVAPIDFPAKHQLFAIYPSKQSPLISLAVSVFWTSPCRGSDCPIVGLQGRLADAIPNGFSFYWLFVLSFARGAASSRRQHQPMLWVLYAARTVGSVWRKNVHRARNLARNFESLKTFFPMKRKTSPVHLNSGVYIGLFKKFGNLSTSNKKKKHAQRYQIRLVQYLLSNSTFSNTSQAQANDICQNK